MDLDNYPLTSESANGLAIRAMEECSEVIKAASKLYRFGFGNSKYNNLKKLHEEMKDVELVFAEIKARWPEPKED